MLMHQHQKMLMKIYIVKVILTENVHRYINKYMWKTIWLCRLCKCTYYFATDSFIFWEFFFHAHSEFQSLPYSSHSYPHNFSKQSKFIHIVYDMSHSKLWIWPAYCTNMLCSMPTIEILIITMIVLASQPASQPTNQQVNKYNNCFNVYCTVWCSL